VFVRRGGALAGAALAALLALTPPLMAGQRLPAPPPARFTVGADGHELTVWARVPETPRAAILLLHGRTWSSRPDYDLQVPGLQRSVMQSLADRGVAAYALDFRGYGGTPRDASGWLTPGRSAKDVIHALGWLRGRHADLPAPALLGWSRGAAVAQLVAQSSPDRVSSLTVFGFGSAETGYADLPHPEQPQRIENTEASAKSDFISPHVTPPSVVGAFAAQALEADPVLADLKGDSEFNALNPELVSVPTLVLFGARDPGVVMSDAAAYFARLASVDKQMVVLPGADHAAQLEDTHEAWIAAVVNFLTRPTAGR
jgi:pimeloyl-ACP methyl ester carboxylesterase